MNTISDFELISGLIIFLLGSLCTLVGGTHALLNKRDPRSALAWIAMCVALPFLGALLYYVFGKNRIRTRAQRLTRNAAEPMEEANMGVHEASVRPDYRNLAQLPAASSKRRLLAGNSVAPLYNGDEAYPAMLTAIEKASSYIYLATYIFETGPVGREFIEALGRAKRRGVSVKVLVDGVGEKYDFPFVSGQLQAQDVDVALYLPPTLFPPNLTINLRNHRKLLLVDGAIGFTGGMNIRQNHLKKNNQNGFTDVHFSLSGPVLRQLERVFVNDWLFTTDESLPWNEAVGYPQIKDDMACRVLLEGPNEDVDKLTWVLVGAISLAKESILIMTPYFLPSRELEVALQTAAMRGVDVSVVLPGKNNLPFMTWATTHVLPQLLNTGVKIFSSPAPFVHSKLFVVDDYYVQLGSSNLDPRSLRLNFELVVEVYDQEFGQTMAAHARDSIAQASVIDMSDINVRSLTKRIRDAFFWLFSPYL